MANYEITGPDGKRYQISAPEGATEQQILTYAKSQMIQEEKKNGSVSSFLRGLRDTIDAPAQMLEKSLPENVVSSINQFNNWLADQGIPLERIGPGGLTEQLKQQEAAYQAARKAAGETGFDWGRLSGNIASPVNLALASKIPQAATLGGKMVTGLLGGTMLGTMQAPVYGEDFWKQKGTQSLLGGVGGAIAPAATTGIARVIAPKIDPAIKAIKDAGIRTTVGQRLGGLTKNLEDKATSIPGLGHMIQARRAEGFADFGRNKVKEALQRVGKRLPSEVEPGHRSLAYLQSELGKSYDSLLDGMKVKIDSTMQKDMDTVFDMAKTLPEDIQKYLYGVVDREINQRSTKYGLMSGQSLKEAQSGLGSEIASIVNPSGWDMKKKMALMEIKDSFMRMVARQNPGAKAKKLKDIDKSWREFEVMNRAASSVGAEDGIFTPAQLYNASKALDKSKNKRAFGQGRATLQGYAGAGKKVLPSEVPDSGTAGRMMVSSPISGLGSATMGLPFLPLYSKAGSRLADKVLTYQRPPFADPIADIVESSGRYMIPGFGAISQGIFGPSQ